VLLCRLRQDHGFDERRVASVFIFFCYEREFIYAHRCRGWGGGRTALHTFSERGRIPQNYFNFPHTHISGVIILCNKKCSWSLIQIFFPFSHVSLHFSCLFYDPFRGACTPLRIVLPWFDPCDCGTPRVFFLGLSTTDYLDFMESVAARLLLLFLLAC